MKIIVLSFNHPEITSKTLSSALEFASFDQVLLVHNGSLPQHQSKLQNQFPKIEHFILPENRGFSGGANAGLKLAFSQGHDWVLFLTNDCLLTKLGPPPGDICLAAPIIWRRQIGKADSLGGKLNLSKAELRHCLSLDDFHSKEDLSYVPGTAFWIHRDIFNETAGFDESLGTYWEDVDLSLRLRGKLKTAPETEIIHSVGKTCHGDIFYTTYLFQRNRKWVCFKYARGFQKILVLTSLAKSWSKTLFKLILKGDWQKMALLWKSIVD